MTNFGLILAILTGNLLSGITLLKEKNLWIKMN